MRIDGRTGTHKSPSASENERKEREREQLEEMEQRDELKMGNPLLRDEMTSADDDAPKGKKSATLKRRWDDDTVFRKLREAAEEREEVRERYHSKRFPQKVFEQIHQVITLKITYRRKSALYS